MSIFFLDSQNKTSISSLSNRTSSELLFLDISLGESTVPTFADTAIHEGTYDGAYNARVFEVVSGNPVPKPIKMASGAYVNATIDSFGNITLTGTPVATDYAVVWIVDGTVGALAGITSSLVCSNILTVTDFLYT